MTTKPGLVILSGGAESVSIAVAESAWRLGLPYAVLSLVPDSLLRNAPGCVACESLWSQHVSPLQARERLADSLRAVAAASEGQPLPVLPTEDDGLRLLNEAQPDLAGLVEFSRGRRLRMGGLDKAELFEVLDAAGLSSLLAPSLRMERVEQLDEALDLLGEDAVIKPAFKPWAGSLGGPGLKVITRQSVRESRAELRRRLRGLWHLAPHWVAQMRLHPWDSGERSACIVRADSVRGCEVVERMKYPAMGGSAVVVDSVASRDLIEPARRIAEAIDLKGLCEMSFLRDHDGNPRLLELNTRPWLQVELVERSGYPIVGQALRSLEGLELDADDRQIEPRTWIQLERLVICWLSGEAGPRIRSAARIIGVLKARPIVAVWSSAMPGVRWRWLSRAVGKLMARLRAGHRAERS